LKYGKFVDNYGEFFIANVEVSSDQATGNNPSSNPSFQSSDTSSELVDIWTYEINYNSLPIYFSKSWAEKVFFIGQTVLMFNSDVTNNVDRDQDKLLKQTIWHEHEQKFFGKFIELQQRDHFSVVSFEQIVDEIKCYVTERLSLILVKDSDLVKHLKLLRDFYLLGRGELYCELIKSLDEFHTDKLTENTIKELNRIFHKTATSVNIPDVLELFTLDTYKGEVEESFSLNPNKPKPVLNVLTLKYNVKWPLHLLFSPKVLENYNDLFRFMMKIKKNQQNLYAVWHHHRQEKIAINNKLFEFRNNLMFFIDNLQYYLQVEVVESQYSIMMKKIEERNDFEQIQKAHNCFLANVLSLCFMLENTEHSMILSRSMGLSSESQVFIIINNILKLIENFTGFAFICSDPMTEKEDESFRKFGILFNREIEALLMKLRNLQGSAPVAQLLLRLDFNYYFSSQIDKREEENEPESIEQLIY
jgi:gamma-tubulin complex component 4